jgi:hypothetical protein
MLIESCVGCMNKAFRYTCMVLLRLRGRSELDGEEEGLLGTSLDGESKRDSKSIVVLQLLVMILLLREIMHSASMT